MDGENHGKPDFSMDDLGGKPTIFGNTHIIFSLIDILMNQGFIGASWHIKPTRPANTTENLLWPFPERFPTSSLVQKYHASQTAHLIQPLIFVDGKKKISTSSAILADSPKFLPIESFDLFTKTHQLCFKKHPCSFMMLQLVGPPKTGTSHSNRTSNCPVRGATWSEHSRSSKRSSTIFSAWRKKKIPHWKSRTFFLIWKM